MQWLWRTETSSDAEHQGHHPYVRKIRTVPCIFLLCVSTTVLVVAWMFVIIPVAPHNVFRASHPVEDRREANAMIELVEPVLTKLLRIYPKACGFAAINAHVYEQFMVMRYPPDTDKTTQDHGESPHRVIFNPVVEPDLQSEKSDHLETSYMCPDDHTGIRRTRYSKVTARYRDAHWIPRTRVFEGAEAVCLQHFYEVMRGQWPCNPGKLEPTQYHHFVPKDIHSELA